MIKENNQKFPRALAEREIDWLQFILPESKKGYAIYRKKIEDLYVIGFGRFGGSNLVLGENNDKPDLSAPSSPVFASGNIVFKEAEIYVLIHEEFEDQIEIDISNINGNFIPQELTEISRWTYSEWEPGLKAPGDGALVREIPLVNDEAVIAVVPSHKRIWVYERKTGVNYFIPVTNLFNEIMRLRGIKYHKNLPTPNSLFTENSSYSDEEIAQGFLLYNKQWNKIKLDYSLFKKEIKKKRKKTIFDLFKYRG